MVDEKTASPGDIAQVLGQAHHGGGRRRAVKWIVVLAVLGLAAWVAMSLFSSSPAQYTYQTADAKRGDLTVSVTATGTLQPVNQVDVGTEISGTVESVDVDFNDRVKRGQVLATLNTDQLSAKLRQSQAALELARANVQTAQATVLETRTKYNRLKTLAAKGMASQDDLDTAAAAFTRANAAVEVAKAQVTQAQAQVDADRTSLQKAQIRSPIDGIVLKREVEPGQTVAASLQTPVLFTLAENLTQMELNVAVDEADVGQVKKGQKASFTVDAFPGRTFPAVIDQVRYAPQTVQGVVTYETVLLVDNSDLTLRPGMTATVDIVVGDYRNVLLVPNAALRFTPPATQAKSSGGSLFSRLFPRPRRSAPATREAGDAGARTQRVWVLRDGQPVAIPIQVGASDGQMTQVLSGDLQPGTALLTDVTRTTK
jgi:HlyD family secretion protein